MIVLDASVLIAPLDATDSHHQRADRLLAASGSETLSASVVTLAEVLVGPSRTGAVDRALAALEQLAVYDRLAAAATSRGLRLFTP